MGRSRSAAAGLAAGFAIVLAGPSLLVWNSLRPRPWTARDLRAKFQSVRYEAAALVFTYSVENRTGRSVYLAPNATRVVIRQANDGPAAGYPFVQFPVELAAHSLQPVEVVLNLPGQRDPGGRIPLSAEDSDFGPLPPLKHDPPAEAPNLDATIAKSLQDLDGFELVNERKGLHIVLPRGW